MFGYADVEKLRRVCAPEPAVLSLYLAVPCPNRRRRRPRRCDDSGNPGSVSSRRNAEAGPAGVTAWEGHRLSPVGAQNHLGSVQTLGGLLPEEVVNLPPVGMQPSPGPERGSSTSRP